MAYSVVAGRFDVAVVVEVTVVVALWKGLVIENCSCQRLLTCVVIGEFVVTDVRLRVDKTVVDASGVIERVVDVTTTVVVFVVVEARAVTVLGLAVRVRVVMTRL